MPARRPGPWILGLLEAFGVEMVFGIPGVHTVPLYDGLAASAIRHVTPRHEQGAGFMADGYGRVSGKPGVCLVISGPGLTNILTAMGQAHADSVPMLVISSVTARRSLRQGEGHLHELPDQQAMAAGVAAFSHSLHSLADLPGVLARAFAVFSGARPRPVHIEIPLDLWEESPPDSPPPRLASLAASLAAPLAAPTAPPDAIKVAAAALNEAARPVILAGGGARGAGLALQRLATHLNAPVVMTAAGRGLLPSDHPLAVPASPSLDAVRSLIAESDATLAVGTEIGPTDYDLYGTGLPALPSPLVRIDIEPAQLTRNRAADIGLVGDAKPCLAALEATLEAAGRPRGDGRGARRAARARAAAWAELAPPLGRWAATLAAIREALPDAILVGDSTRPAYAGNLFYAAPAPGRWFNAATGFGTLGYGLPAAIGAALAAPKRPVVCLTGDGGLHYVLGELASLRQTEARVLVVIWDNAGYGEIRDAMTAAGVAPVGVELGAPDYAALAAAYGLPFEAPAGLEALPAALAAAARRGGPGLLHLDQSRAEAGAGPPEGGDGAS